MILIEDKLDNVIGFQIYSIMDFTIHPKIKNSSCVYSLPQCMSILLKSPCEKRRTYKIIHITKNIIETPKMMFTGNPFTAKINLLTTK